VVLHIQDGSQVDYRGPRARAGLGPIGDGGGWGFLLHTTLTVDPQTPAYEFWREVAKLGGFLARRRDGEPGWQTLWRG
jgi:hypothetical protein